MCTIVVAAFVEIMQLLLMLSYVYVLYIFIYIYIYSMGIVVVIVNLSLYLKLCAASLRSWGGERRRARGLSKGAGLSRNSERKDPAARCLHVNVIVGLHLLLYYTLYPEAENTSIANSTSMHKAVPRLLWAHLLQISKTNCGIPSSMITAVTPIQAWVLLQIFKHRCWLPACMTNHGAGELGVDSYVSRYQRFATELPH